MFRFHTGSIKSSMLIGVFQHNHKFRFHTGSIKSLYKNRKHIIHDPYGPCQADFYFRVCKVFGSAFLEIRVDVLEKNRYPLEN